MAARWLRQRHAPREGASPSGSASPGKLRCEGSKFAWTKRPALQGQTAVAGVWSWAPGLRRLTQKCARPLLPTDPRCRTIPPCSVFEYGLSAKKRQKKEVTQLANKPMACHGKYVDAALYEQQKVSFLLPLAFTLIIIILTPSLDLFQANLCTWQLSQTMMN